MNNFAFLYLMGAPAEGANPLTTFLPLILVFVVFYFFMIRPQMKKQKELKNYREGLTKGDKVITAGGIHGRILEVQDTAIMLEIDQNVKVKVDKGSVVRSAQEAAAAQKK